MMCLLRRDFIRRILQRRMKSALKKLPDLLKHHRIVAVGETGLDFYRDYAPREVQERAFRAHIRLAREMDSAADYSQSGCRDAGVRRVGR